MPVVSVILGATSTGGVRGDWQPLVLYLFRGRGLVEPSRMPGGTRHVPLDDRLQPDFLPNPVRFTGIGLPSLAHQTSCNLTFCRILSE